MQKIIVTGGAGFIGSHTVVELCAAGYLPVIVDDLRNSDERVLEGLRRITGAPVTLHRLDCTDPKAMEAVFARESPVHGAIHFAAYKAVGESMAEPMKYYHNNIGSLVVLMEALRRHGTKALVFSSSCTVYGQPRTLPVTEASPDHTAASPYGWTKVMCERIIRDECTADPALKAMVLRYFNPIGAHPSAHIGELPIGVPNNLVPYVTQAAAGLRDRLTVNGDDYDTPDGSCVRDYIHVVDLAKAHVKALQRVISEPGPLHDVVNLGAGKGNSVLEVVRVFEEVTGIKVPFRIGPRRSGDVASVYADTTKSHAVLDWKCELDLADALRDAWHWQQNLA